MNQFQVEFQLCVRWRVLWLVNFVLSTSSFRIFHLFTFDLYKSAAILSFETFHAAARERSKANKEKWQTLFYFCEWLWGENLRISCIIGPITVRMSGSCLVACTVARVTARVFSFLFRIKSISHEKVKFSAVIFQTIIQNHDSRISTSFHLKKEKYMAQFENLLQEFSFSTKTAAET